MEMVYMDDIYFVKIFRRSSILIQAGMPVHSLQSQGNRTIDAGALDLSKAFESLDRGTLIQILEENELAGEDELRIISYLLSETTLRVKVGSNISETFKTTIGTPQGDALSPILFLIYLEHILRRHRRRNILTAVELEMAYADNIHYVTKDDLRINFNFNLITIM